MTRETRAEARAFTDAHVGCLGATSCSRVTGGTQPMLQGVADRPRTGSVCYWPEHSRRLAAGRRSNGYKWKHPRIQACYARTTAFPGGTRPARSAPNAARAGTGKAGASVAWPATRAVRLWRVSARTRIMHSSPAASCLRRIRRDWPWASTSRVTASAPTRRPLLLMTESMARRSRGSGLTGTSVCHVHPSPMAARNRSSNRSWPASRSGDPPGNARIEMSRPTTAPQRTISVKVGRRRPTSQAARSGRDTPSASATAAWESPA